MFLYRLHCILLGVESNAKGVRSSCKRLALSLTAKEIPMSISKILSSIALVAIGATTTAAAATAAASAVSLTQEPVVMRLNKDEFRIAFGINAEGATAKSCIGTIHYTVDWTTDDGLARSESRHVSYTVPQAAHRTITVDRQFFDTREGAHTTNVVKVHVDKITCLKS